MLAAINIEKTFDRFTALKGVSAQVEAGKITAVVGPSGAGKTTLVRAMALLDPPTLGSIVVDDRQYDFPRNPDQTLQYPWPRVTVVFQELFLWPHLTLRENILLPLRYRTDDRGIEYVEELVLSFGMREFVDRYPDQVSVGQRQRAAIVRALALRPAYVLLDEITSALDVEQIARVLDQLQVLRDSGIGVLIVTHLLSFARKAADRVVFLDGGFVLEAGGADVLLEPSHERVKKFLSEIEAAR